MSVTLSPRRILGVSDTASADEIKQAYRTMALKWHPDRHNQGKEIATKHFVKVNNAYKALVQDEQLETGAPSFPVVHKRTAAAAQPHRGTSSTSSAESSRSSSSFVHIAPSSAEALITPPTSYTESIRPPRKQGQPKSFMNQYPRPAETPNRSRMPLPSTNFHQRPPFIPSHRPPDLANATSGGRERSFPGAHRSQNLRDVNGPHKSMPFSILTPSTSLNASSGPPRSKKVYASPYNLPLASLGVGPSGESIYSLSLSLEDLLKGKHFQFSITRRLLSGRSRSIVLDVDIPPGCRTGTKILCRNVGNEGRNGISQDIVFIIEEAYHERFKRVVDDLVMDIQIPWSDILPRQGAYIEFAGLEGWNLAIRIDYSRIRSMKGASVINGAGMPIREGGLMVGRGNLIVQWEILPPQAKVMQFVNKVWRSRQ